MALRLALSGLRHNAQNPISCDRWRDEKPQQLRRLSPPLIRQAGELCAATLAAALGLGLTRLYELRTDAFRACAEGRADSWPPGLSGGDHSADGPADALALATRLLSSSPRSSYGAVASELPLGHEPLGRLGALSLSKRLGAEWLRRLDFKTNRASLRRRATAHPARAGDPLEKARKTRSPLAGP